MKITLALFCIFYANIQLFSQFQTDSSFHILARHIKYIGGDKIHFSAFIFLKDLSDKNIMLRDTIYVGYQTNNIEFANQDYLLRIKKWEKGYFKFPDFNTNNNFETVNIEQISYEFWSNCEIGKDCKTINIVRNRSLKHFIIIPCGGSYTSICLKGKDINKCYNFDMFSCPPYIDLSHLPDDNYSISMLACSLGGNVNFKLSTK